MKKLFLTFKSYVKKLNKEILVLYFAYKDQRTPIRAKILSIAVVAYAVSPIDLIPDFIPVLGYVDDIIIVPLGITICLKLIPKSVLIESRRKAQIYSDLRLSKNWYVGMLIILLWLVIIFFIGLWLYNMFYH